MKRIPAHHIFSIAIVTALALANPAEAKEYNADVSCNARSDYTVSLSGDAFVFENDQGRNIRVVLGGGKLFLNGKPVVLPASDQKRIDAFESELRLLVPESRKVAAEAVGMAIDALSVVSIAMSGDESKRADYDKVRSKALAATNNAKTLPFFNDDAMKDIIDPIVLEFVPSITSNALGFAMKAMFAGEQKNKAMEARMNAMEKDLDIRMDARAKELEPLAKSMCNRIQRLDVIDNSLEVRLPNGKPLNFLEAKIAP